MPLTQLAGPTIVLPTPGPQGLPGAPGEQVSIATRALAAATAFAVGVVYLRTAGYAAPGDGGAALYKKVGSEPAHAGKFQSVDGAWWEIAEPAVNCQQFGASTAASDNVAAFVAFLTYLGLKGGTGFIPDVGIYTFLGEVIAAATKGFSLISSGAILRWPATASGGYGIRINAGIAAMPILPYNIIFETGHAATKEGLYIDYSSQITGGTRNAADYSVQPGSTLRGWAEKLTFRGMTAAATDGWKNGLTVNCGRRFKVHDCLSFGYTNDGQFPTSFRGYNFICRDWITRSITGITQANPAVVTYSGDDHPGDDSNVYVDGVVGMTQVNGMHYRVANVNTGARTFQLRDTDSTGFSAYVSGGVAEASPQTTNIEVVNCKGAWVKELVYFANCEGKRVTQCNATPIGIGVRDQLQAALEVYKNHFNVEEYGVLAENVFEGQIKDNLIYAHTVSPLASATGVELRNCTDLNTEADTFKSTGLPLEPIRYKNCLGGIIDANTFDDATTACIHLEGTTDEVLVGDSNRPGASGPTKLILDTSTGTRNRYSGFSKFIPDTTAADQNNYSPTGYSDVLGGPDPTLNVTPTASILITGIGQPFAGKTSALLNATGAAGAAARLIILPHEAGASSAANRLLFADRMPRFLMPGDLLELKYDLTAARWRERTPGNWRRAFGFFHDFFGSGPPETTNGTAAAVAAGSYLADQGGESPFGIRSLSTGTDTTGGAALGEFTSKVRAGRGAALFLARVAVETLSDGTNTYAVRVGFHDAPANVADVQNGVYWEYDSTVAAAWRRAAAGSGTRSKNTGGATVGTDYIWLGIFLNGDWTQADYFYSADGAVWVFDGSITGANLPTGAETIGFGAQIKKSAGTTSRNLHVDLMAVQGAVIRGS